MRDDLKSLIEMSCYFSKDLNDCYSSDSLLVKALIYKSNSATNQCELLIFIYEDTYLLRVFKSVIKREEDSGAISIEEMDRQHAETGLIDIKELVQVKSPHPIIMAQIENSFSKAIKMGMNLAISIHPDLHDELLLEYKSEVFNDIRVVFQKTYMLNKFRFKLSYFR